MKGAGTMKRNNLILGIIYSLAGVIFLALALLTETKLAGLFFGFAGVFISIGIVMVCKYIYWTSPKNREIYKEMLEKEKIEMHDELKEKIRGKSAQYTYAAGLFIISFSTVLFFVLDSLEIIENGNIFVYYLCGYLLLQVIIGSVIFKHLMKKY